MPTDQKDHINPLVPSIKVADGVNVPKEAPWVPAWAKAFGNGEIPLDKMVEVAAKLGAAGALIPEVAGRWQALVQAAATNGFELTMTGAYRTLQQQIELFDERMTLDKASSSGTEPRNYDGKTYWLKPNCAMVASPGTSNHGWGCAIDMALRVNGKVVAVTAQFVEWAASVAIGFGFSWEDSEPWHIHAIETADAPAPTSPSSAGSGEGSQRAPAGSLPAPTLRLGSSGPQVEALQQLLSAHGWGDCGQPDGHFGARTQAAVKVMQQAIGVIADGDYGPGTAHALAQHQSS